MKTQQNLEILKWNVILVLVDKKHIIRGIWIYISKTSIIVVNVLVETILKQFTIRNNMQKTWREKIEILAEFMKFMNYGSIQLTKDIWNFILYISNIYI